MRTDVNAGDAGAVGQGTVIEVEAKLGHIIDMDSRDRIQLPISTESVMNKENGRFRTSFESKMTVVSRISDSTWGYDCANTRRRNNTGL